MHPFRHEVLHVDFQRVDESRKIHMQVPLHFTSTPSISPAVKTTDAIISHVLTELDVVVPAQGSAGIHRSRLVATRGRTIDPRHPISSCRQGVDRRDARHDGAPSSRLRSFRASSSRRSRKLQRRRPKLRRPRRCGGAAEGAKPGEKAADKGGEKPAEQGWRDKAPKNRRQEGRQEVGACAHCERPATDAAAGLFVAAGYLRS